MKTISNIILALLFCSLLLSCSKDDDIHETPTLLIADLFEDTSIMENSSEIEFKVDFNRPSAVDGSIVLKVTSTNNEEFQTNPPVINGEIELEVTKGSGYSIFTISPVNNNLVDGNSTVKFELEESSEGISFGTKRTADVVIMDDDTPATASFVTPSLNLLENEPGGVEVKILLAGFSVPESSLLVEIEGNTDNYFISSYPAMDQNQRITIPVASGTLYTTFQIYPRDNSLLENHHDLKLRLVPNNAGVNIGSLSEINLSLKDDEIYGKIKSVETVTTNGKRDKRTYEYGVDGKVNKVLWEDETASQPSGTNNYYYSSNGLIESVSSFPGDGEDFFWENGKVVRSEVISGFAKVGYSLYDYNTAGRISTKTTYKLKTGGSFEQYSKHEYEYYDDGNLKKESIFKAGSNNTWVFESSLALDSYTDRMNPASIEIIPTLKVQEHLPLYYTFIKEGVNIVHYYINKFNEENRITERKSQLETVTYSYY
ncbi:hypothetical protein [Salinimicrobium sp. TH3]|uniref:hypothetical protein n=1 Tax=Salinimicrobium sp. TH3 TaxID=2997342 RepID=UPI0022760E4E|nr:hypothetical protein [Salinimicrobium sp. TH3]MCY2686012.1 hypothetical protein [Salinimicrobium sp. TH3]